MPTVHLTKIQHDIENFLDKKPPRLNREANILNAFVQSGKQENGWPEDPLAILQLILKISTRVPSAGNGESASSPPTPSRTLTVLGLGRGWRISPSSRWCYYFTTTPTDSLSSISCLLRFQDGDTIMGRPGFHVQLADGTATIPRPSPLGRSPSPGLPGGAHGVPQHHPRSIR